MMKEAVKFSGWMSFSDGKPDVGVVKFVSGGRSGSYRLFAVHSSRSLASRTYYDVRHVEVTVTEKKRKDHA